MHKNDCLIRVGFAILGSKQWLGGMTYLFNLLFAISKLDNKNKKIHPIIFLGEKAEENVVSMYKPCAELLRTPIYDRWHALWFANTILTKLTGTNYFLDRVLVKNDIKVFSHALMPIRKKSRYKVIGWIPDFQHIHMPEMFSKKEVNFRNGFFSKMVEESDIVILSSYDALEDLKKFAPEFSSKARVLHFVSQPDPQVYGAGALGDILGKHGVTGKYFFLPNQFWKHKNHEVVFKAVKILKEQGKNITVVCSGPMGDYRNKNHVGNLKAYIRDNGLEANIKLLGLIGRTEMFYLFRNCISVINPSLFEGWSTTVEEAKSMGKNVVLSNIGVHREQNPAGSFYFNPLDPEDLAELLSKRWNESNGGPDYELEEKAKVDLPGRTVQFAKNYQDIVLEIA